MIDEKCLLALARDANFIEMDAEQVAFHAASVAAINRKVADGALSRVRIDQPPGGFDTFRLHYAADGR